MSDPLDDWFRAELAATMRPCPELPFGERMAKRAADAVQQKRVEEMHAETVDECVQPVEKGAA